MGGASGVRVLVVVMTSFPAPQRGIVALRPGICCLLKEGLVCLMVGRPKCAWDLCSGMPHVCSVLILVAKFDFRFSQILKVRGSQVN